MTELTPKQERLIKAGWKYNETGWYLEQASDCSALCEIDCSGLCEIDAVRIQEIIDRWS